VQTRAGPEEFTDVVDAIKPGQMVQILELKHTTIDAAAAVGKVHKHSMMISFLPCDF
jgi:hypothetical protein